MSASADVCETFPAVRDAPGFDIPYCWSAIMQGPEECRCAGTSIGDANLADDAWRRSVLTRYYRFRERSQAQGKEARRERETVRLRADGLVPLPAAIEVTDRQPTYPWRSPNRPTVVRVTHFEDRG